MGKSFLPLKEHVIKGHLVGTSSLEGKRMPLQLRRIGCISEEEHAADVDSKVAENSTTATAWKLWEALQHLHHPFCQPPEERTNALPSSQDPQQAASQSTEASGKGRGLWQTPWAETS